MHNISLRNSVMLAVDNYLAILDGEIPGEGIYKIITSEVERELFKFVYYYHQSNQTLATKTLGISRATFRKKIIEFGLI